MCYLSGLGVFLQLVQLRVAGLQETLEYGVIMQTALSSDQLHSFSQLLHIQQHILQGHYTHTHATHTQTCMK